MEDYIATKLDKEVILNDVAVLQFQCQLHGLFGYFGDCVF